MNDTKTKTICIITALFLSALIGVLINSEKNSLENTDDKYSSYNDVNLSIDFKKIAFRNLGHGLYSDIKLSKTNFNITHWHSELRNASITEICLFTPIIVFVEINSTKNCLVKLDITLDPLLSLHEIHNHSSFSCLKYISKGSYIYELCGMSIAVPLGVSIYFRAVKHISINYSVILIMPNNIIESDYVYHENLINITDND